MNFVDSLKHISNGLKFDVYFEDVRLRSFFNDSRGLASKFVINKNIQKDLKFTFDEPKIYPLAARDSYEYQIL